MQPPLPRLISRSEMAQLTGLHIKTLDYMVAAGDFPAPLRISRQRLAWPEPTYLGWLGSRPKAA